MLESFTHADSQIPIVHAHAFKSTEAIHSSRQPDPMSTHRMSSSSPILHLIPRQESIPFNPPVTDEMKQLESSFVHHHENDEPVKPSPTVTELNVTTDRMIDEAFQLEPETLKSSPKRATAVTGFHQT